MPDDGKGKKANINKGYIFFGVGRDETAIEHMERRKETAGFQKYIEVEGSDEKLSEWFVFPGRIYKDMLKYERFTHSLELFSQASQDVVETAKLKEIEDFSERMRVFTEMVSAEMEDLGKHNEYILHIPTIIKKYIHYVNEATLHEVCYHVAGGLIHKKFPVSLMFRDTPIEKGLVYDILKKYKFKSGDVIVHIAEGDRISGIGFDEEPDRDSLDGLYEEVKAYAPDAKRLVAREEFPVEFGIDDIKIGERDTPYGFFKKIRQKSRRQPSQP